MLFNTIVTRPLMISGSSVISSAEYDASILELTIIFRRGQTYTYSGVSLKVAEGLEMATSPGAYYDARIRGHYTRS